LIYAVAGLLVFAVRCRITAPVISLTPTSSSSAGAFFIMLFWYAFTIWGSISIVIIFITSFMPSYRFDAV